MCGTSAHDVCSVYVIPNRINTVHVLVTIQLGRRGFVIEDPLIAMFFSFFARDIAFCSC
jgi:hypothetical protein